MADIDTSWTWNFTGPTTMSKAQSRSNLPKEISWDLIGFDGNETGCLRTHPGFRQLTGSGGTFTPVSSPANVIGFFPVTFLTSATTYVWGYIWAEYVSSTVNFYGLFHDGTNWLTTAVSNGLLKSYASAGTTEIDVQTTGRNVMLFVRGQKPFLVQLSVSSGVWSFQVNSDLGPGTAPVVASMTGAVTDPGGSRAGSGNLTDMYVSAHSSGTGTTYAVGNYSFAVQYVSTVSGRKSALSNVVTVTTSATNNKINIKVVRLATDYNKAMIYRSVNLGTGSGATAYGSGTLHLETIVDLPSAAVQSYAVTVTDTQLPYQDIYVDKGKSDTYVPKGGVAGFMGSTLFVSRISDSSSGAPSGNFTPEAPPRGVGDMRWSSTGEIQPENFNPSNRWVPRTPGNEVLGMRQVGNYMIALSADRVYRVGRAGAFIKVEEGHVGYGLMGKLALENIGTMVYFVSGGGLKAVSMEGQVEDVTALDNLLNVTWVNTRTTIQMSYDARGQCLTVMQPDTGTGGSNGRAAILWFGTNRVTELIDLPFRYARPGAMYNEGQMQRRTFFVKRNSSTTMGVYVVDHERLVQLPGDSYSAHNLCGGTYLSGNTGSPCLYWYLTSFGVDRPAVIAPSAYDCAAYNVATGERTTVNDVWSQWGLNPETFAGQIISIAPIVQRWVGGNIGMQQVPGQPEFKDFFRQKQISSCRSYYETVLNPEPDDGDGNPDLFPTLVTPTWDAVVYRGTETEPYSSAKPLTHNGSNMASFDFTNSNMPGQIANAPFGRHGVLWSSLSPGWTCYMSGVDVRLLAFSAVGRILDSDRRYV